MTRRDKEFSRIAKITGVPIRSVRHVVNEYYAAISQSLEDGTEVRIPLFGQFLFKYRKARKRKAQTLEHPSGVPRQIPEFMRETVYVKFKWAPQLKARILGAFYERKRITGKGIQGVTVNNTRSKTVFKRPSKTTAGLQRAFDSGDLHSARRGEDQAAD